MDWIISNWQSLAAGTLVAATAAVFALRIIRRRHLEPPCGKDCGCR